MKRYSIFITILGVIGFWVFANSSIIQDKKDVRLIFSHKLHVEENEIECTTCHTEVEESKAGSDNLLPTREVCGACHDVEDEDNCKLCHGDKVPGILPRITEYNEKFSHNNHLTAGQECQNCHSDKLHKEVVLPYILPKMTECIECHKKNEVNHNCSTCHQLEEIKKPASHSINFIHIHSDLARNDLDEISGKNCSTCHQPNYCQTCHEGDNLDRKTHPLNYQFTHSLQAQGKERECAACHTERSFCIDCHRDNQVLPHNHKAGWALTNVGGRHRDEAKSDLESCMACHEQNAEQICQPCHGK